MMTEHRKIIGQTSPADTPARSEIVQSSVERAVAGFDLSRLGGIVLPADGRQRVVMRELSIEPMPERQPDAASTAGPVIDQPAVTPPIGHGPAATAADSALPVVSQTASPTAPLPVTVPDGPSAPLQLSCEPVRFSSVRHAIDRVSLREQGMIVPEGTVSGLMEEFRIVKRQLMLQALDLRRAGAGPAGQRVLICSPLPGEGKTYCATNLALAIAAEKEGDVLLVDADFAKPSVLSTLGLPGGPGLMDALSDPAIDVADCVVGTDVPGLWVLPAGNATNSDSEFLSSSRTRAVLDRLTEGAPNRLVIFDSPPALAASPAADLAKYVGQAVVVARADSTGQSSLEDAIALLSGCPNIQLLLNAVRFSPSGRRFGSYYGYKG